MEDGGVSSIEEEAPDEGSEKDGAATHTQT
jgi:hypothetical protein